MTDLKQTVDDLVRINRQMEKLKQEAASCENVLMADASNRLDATKRRSVRYIGSDGNQVEVVLAQKVSAQFESMLQEIFGKAYGDLVQEKTVVTLTPAAKRLLGGLSQREYSQLTIGAVVDQLTDDPDAQLTLKKKLKGKNPSTDAKHLMRILNVDQQEADLYAYFVQEAAVWQDFQNLLMLNNRIGADAEEELLKKIDTAIICEDIPKMTVISGEGVA